VRIETGSQNLSRIPGNYVYPLVRYNPNPVEDVNAVKARIGRAPDLYSDPMSRLKPLEDESDRLKLYRPENAFRPGKLLEELTGRRLNLLA